MKKELIQNKAEIYYQDEDWGMLWELERFAEKKGVDISYWTTMDDYTTWKAEQLAEIKNEDAYDNARDMELEMESNEEVHKN